MVNKQIKKLMRHKLSVCRSGKMANYENTLSVVLNCLCCDARVIEWKLTLLPKYFEKNTRITTEHHQFLFGNTYRIYQLLLTIFLKASIHQPMTKIVLSFCKVVDVAQLKDITGLIKVQEFIYQDIYVSTYLNPRQTCFWVAKPWLFDFFVPVGLLLSFSAEKVDVVLGFELFICCSITFKSCLHPSIFFKSSALW